MHWCTPNPKPRCPRGFRSISNASGWSTNEESQFPAGMFISTRSPARMNWPLMVRSSSGDPVDLGVHDGQVAHQLFDEIGDQVRIVGFAAAGQLFGVLQ